MKSLLGWFAANPVAANLLMLLIVLGGIASLGQIEQEVFPRLNLNRILVTAEYPGASPVEVEQVVCIPIENALHDLESVHRLDTAIEGDNCTVKALVRAGYALEGVMNAVRARTQSLPRLPRAVEPIRVKEDRGDSDDGVIWVALYGPTDTLSLKRLGERIRLDLARLPGVEQALDYGDLRDEIAIQVSAVKLQQYGLTLTDVAEAVRRASVDLPGGAIKALAGELVVRVEGQARHADSFADLILTTRADGMRVRLGEIATIVDGLQERWFEWHHDGQPGIGWEIHAKRSTVAVARAVKQYVEEQALRLPEGIRLVTWWDDSQAFDQRVRTLLEDGVLGFALVVLVLALFLRTRVAFWAGVGILTSVLGTLWLMPLLDIPLNMFSLFGFLLAMGILVDDAIIVSERIHAHQARGSRLQATGEDVSDFPATSGLQPKVYSLEPGLNAAIRGVREVAGPIVLAVVIAGVAFLPGLFLPGWAGQMVGPICLVMILTLVFSLIEALLILPAHLANGPPHPNPLPPGEREFNWSARLRAALNGGLAGFVERRYRPWLHRVLEWRYLTLAVFATLLLCTSVLVAGGYVRLSFNPDVTKDTLWVELKVPPGTPFAETQALAGRVEQAFFDLRAALNRRQPEGAPSMISQLESLIYENWAGFWLEVASHARQWLDIEAMVHDWRERLGDLGRATIDFHYREGDTAHDLEFDLSAPDPALLTRAAEALKQKLAAYPGVFDINDSTTPGKPEVWLALKPEAERLGLRLKDLAEQVRGGFYGEEAQRLVRGHEEVKVMVRYPLAERQSLDYLQAMPVRLPQGGSAPLGTLAEVSFAPGSAYINRQDRQRILQVWARVDNREADANAIYADLEQHHLEALERQFPGVRVDVSQRRIEQEAMAPMLLRNALLALVVIYALIAIPFRSYLQPLLFMVSVPVAWMGAVVAHWLFGLPLSMESLVGMVAASGVVVNDSLVLLDYIKERQRGAFDTASLICEACTARFRPILLAFLTNFVGFLPMLLERSEQAQFLVPMTVSLSAGLLFGIVATLILTPACYALLEDVGWLLRRRGKRTQAAAEVLVQRLKQRN